MLKICYPRIIRVLFLEPSLPHPGSQRCNLFSLNLQLCTVFTSNVVFLLYYIIIVYCRLSYYFFYVLPSFCPFTFLLVFIVNIYVCFSNYFSLCLFLPLSFLTCQLLRSYVQFVLVTLENYNDTCSFLAEVFQI